MDLYEIVPEYLFSVLVSKNKRLYVNSLFVLLDAFKTHLQISKDALVSMLIAALENEIILTLRISPSRKTLLMFTPPIHL